MSRFEDGLAFETKWFSFSIDYETLKLLLEHIQGNPITSVVWVTLFFWFCYVFVLTTKGARKVRRWQFGKFIRYLRGEEGEDQEEDEDQD